MNAPSRFYICFPLEAETKEIWLCYSLGRVLDIIEIFIKKQPSNPLVLVSIFFVVVDYHLQAPAKRSDIFVQRWKNMFDRLATCLRVSSKSNSFVQ